LESMFPPLCADMRPRLVFGSDHAGQALKDFLVQTFAERGRDVHDCGGQEGDYPDVIPSVVEAVRGGAQGVLICGSGIGMSIGANRFIGIRAALCGDPLMVTLARTHNDANILALGSRFLSFEEAILCVEAFVTTPFSGEARHLRRIAKLDGLSQ